jgi:hypothetical protein
MVALGVAALGLLSPILSWVDRIQQQAGLGEDILGPVLKTMCIGVVTELGTGVCQDVGESALGKSLELVGSLGALYVLLPLLEGLLELVEGLL